MIDKLNNKIKLKMEGLNIGRSCFFWFFFFFLMQLNFQQILKTHRCYLCTHRLPLSWIYDCASLLGETGCNVS